MRAADGPVPGDPGDLLPGDRDAQLLEPEHHGLRPGNPVVPHELALPGQFGLGRVEEVGQHVQADTVDLAGELGARDEGEAFGQGGSGFRVTADRVVIGQGDDVQARRGGVGHQLGGGVRAVGSGGVGVQIDAHDAYSSAGGRTGDAQG